MVMHNMNLAPEPFEKIADGAKTIEMRLDDERRKDIAVGDYITFTNNSDGRKTVVRVKALHRFSDFAQLYRTLDLTKCGYEPNQVQQASAEDMNLYYTLEQQSRYGALGIEIEVVSLLPSGQQKTDN